jgi:hypothetical protein
LDFIQINSVQWDYGWKRRHWRRWQSDHLWKEGGISTVNGRANLSIKASDRETLPGVTGQLRSIPVGLFGLFVAALFNGISL